MNIDKPLIALLALLPAVALAQDAPAGSQWQTEEHHEEELDLHFVVLKTHAIGLAQPTIVFRCFEDTTVAYFNLFGQDETETYEYGPVTVQLDDEEPETYEMQAIDGGQAIGFWEGENAIPFIESLLGAQTLAMSVTPVDGDPIEMEFNIEDIDTMIEPIRDTCGW
ncbi:type VI secretion system-associated protein TagO [Halomonas sp. HMF6819]|uniref:type VI secretion system-associated protein TagO n=1 Tax=Halomonas sp. HMF6819 TaxID=3373085 RepID=UPI003789349F